MLHYRNEPTIARQHESGEIYEQAAEDSRQERFQRALSHCSPNTCQQCGSQDGMEALPYWTIARRHEYDLPETFYRFSDLINDLSTPCSVCNRQGLIPEGYTPITGEAEIDEWAANGPTRERLILQQIAKGESYDRQHT